MEWVPVILLVGVFLVIKLSGKDSDKVATDIGQGLAKISSIASKSAKAYKEEKDKYMESIKDLTEPINEVTNDVKSAMKGES